MPMQLSEAVRSFPRTAARIVVRIGDDAGHTVTTAVSGNATSALRDERRIGGRCRTGGV
jgi:hypothetical protein